MLIPKTILSTACVKYVLLFTTKMSELSQKCGYNGSTGVIGYADSEYNVNIRWQILFKKIRAVLVR